MAKMKQCEVVAVVAGKKSRVQKAVTEIHHKVQRAELLDGFVRSYNPKNDEGERYPDEHRHLQVRAIDLAKQAFAEWEDMVNVVATQDIGNCGARADVVVDGVVIASNVPVTHLLYLEKQLDDIHTFIEKMPTLDPAEEWVWDKDVNAYRSKRPAVTQRTKKIQKVITLAQATDKHPAQAQLVPEDEVVGTWSTQKFSGALSAETKNQLLARVVSLQDAVKVARERGNATEVEVSDVGKRLMNYVMQPLQ